MKAMRWLRVPLAIAAVSAVSCASILDIQEAEVDPALEEGAGGKGGGEDAAAGGGGPTGEITCTEYCEKVERNCTGAFEQYPNRDFCMDVCALIPLGTRDDVAGNTLGCRMHFAESAGTLEPEINCSSAGLGGNGLCGTNCEGFCTVVLQACQAEFIGATQCAAACTRLVDLETYNDSMQSGPEVQCRLYHAGAAASIDPGVHCPHTAGARPCHQPVATTD